MQPVGSSKARNVLSKLSPFKARKQKAKEVLLALKEHIVAGGYRAPREKVLEALAADIGIVERVPGRYGGIAVPEETTIKDELTDMLGALTMQERAIMMKMMQSVKDGRIK